QGLHDGSTSITSFLGYSVPFGATGPALRRRRFEQPRVDLRVAVGADADADAVGRLGLHPLRARQRSRCQARGQPQRVVPRRLPSPGVVKLAVLLQPAGWSRASSEIVRAVGGGSGQLRRWPASRRSEAAAVAVPPSRPCRLSSDRTPVRSSWLGVLLF